MKPCLFQFINLFIILFFAIDSFAQSSVKSEITGSIIDIQTGEKVEFANVTLYNTADSMINHAVSKHDGSFIIPSREGVYYIRISFIGYETFQTPAFNITSEKSKINLGEIQIAPSQLQLSGVQIEGKRRQVVYRLDKKVIEASGFISASGGTAVDILEQIPSFRVDIEGELTYRGSAGFKVYIDGKPSSVDGNSALEQIPAGLIENIEVITNPSAKYEADGVVGIININTKKQSVDGWSGMVNAMVSSVESRGIDFSMTRRQNNINWNFSGVASRNYVKSDFDQIKTIVSSDTVTTTHSTGDRVRYLDIFSFKTGMDWLNKSTTYNASLEGRYRVRNRGGDLHYEDSYKPLQADDVKSFSFNGSDFVKLSDWTVRGDIGFTHRFSGEGHSLSGAFYAMYEGDALEYFQTDLYDMEGNREQGHKAWEDEYRLTVQGNLDYIYPFNDKKGKIETGYYFFSYTEDGDYIIKKYQPPIGQFVEMTNLYNKYLFRRDIHALYGIINNSCSKFNYQLGLRGEYTYRKLGNNEKWAEHVHHKLDLFPSLHLSYDFDKRGRTFFAYSRRITQPELFYMEPYVVYVDHYTAQRGNPGISPEYINSFELSYTKSLGVNSITATMFHRARKDKIERIRIPFHTGVTLDSMANVGNDYATGGEISSAIQLKSWWNLDANGSLYYYKIKNEYKTDGKDEESWNWQLALNNNIDITKTTRMRVEAYYVGPSVSTQGRVDDFFYVNLSVRQQLFNRKFNIGLSVRDILSTARYINTQSGAGMDSYTRIYPRSPLVTLTVSYIFNNFSNKKKEEKNSHDLFEGTNR